MAERDTEFLHTHIGIFNDLKEKHKKCKLTIKNNYAKLIYQRYNICEIVLYATNDVFEIDITCGNVDYGGLNDDFGVLNNWYISKETIDDYRKYRAKTLKYLSTLIEYVSDLQFCYEHYNNFCVDYEKAILAFVKQLNFKSEKDITNNDYSFWYTHFKKENVAGDYWLNALANFPIRYINVDAFTDFLKQLISLRNKSDKLNDMCFIENSIECGAIGKKLIASLTPKQKDLFANCIFVDEETIDNMQKEHSLDRQGGFMPHSKDVQISIISLK